MSTDFTTRPVDSLGSLGPLCVSGLFTHFGLNLSAGSLETQAYPPAVATAVARSWKSRLVIGASVLRPGHEPSGLQELSRERGANRALADFDCRGPRRELQARKSTEG